MTWREFIGWAVYLDEDPFGELRADARNAMLCCLLANIHRDPKRGRRTTPEDWMLKFTPRTPVRQTDEEMLRQAEIITKVLGGKDLRNAR